jgi:hypothetical protein
VLYSEESTGPLCRKFAARRFVVFTSLRLLKSPRITPENSGHAINVEAGSCGIISRVSKKHPMNRMQTRIRFNEVI